MRNPAVFIILMTGMILACASQPGRDDAPAGSGAAQSEAGGWRCPYDIEERGLVEARISVYDKYDGMISEIVEDLMNCAPRVSDPAGELAKFAQIVNAYGKELETMGWEDMDEATVANEKYWQSVLVLSANDVTALFVRLLLLMREGMLARAELVSFFCYLDRNIAWERDARSGKTVDRDMQSICAESNRLVEEGIREWDDLNHTRALELYHQALAVDPKNPRALYEIALHKIFAATGSIIVSVGEPAFSAPADPYYGLVRHLSPLYQIAYQGTMTPEVRKAALALVEKAGPAYENLRKGGNVLENMRSLADGFYDMGEYEFALYAYKYGLFHAGEGREIFFEREVVDRISSCLVKLNMEQLVPFLQELLACLAASSTRTPPSEAGENAAAELFAAVRQGDGAAVRRLLEAGADVNVPMEYGWTALGLAASSVGSAEIIRMLLEAGADTEARVECDTPDCRRLGMHDGTPLLQACMRDCDPAIVNLLIAAGADVEARDVNGRNALFSAAVLHDECEIFRMLLEDGADPDVRGDRGWTALIGASMLHGNPEIVRLLLSAGAEVNARDEGGRSVLMLTAAFVRNPEIVAILLNAGADARLKNSEGKTVLDYAAKNPALRGTPEYRLLEEAVSE